MSAKDEGGNADFLRQVAEMMSEAPGCETIFIRLRDDGAGHYKLSSITDSKLDSFVMAAHALLKRYVAEEAPERAAFCEAHADVLRRVEQAAALLGSVIFGDAAEEDGIGDAKGHA